MQRLEQLIVVDESLAEDEEQAGLAGSKVLYKIEAIRHIDVGVHLHLHFFRNQFDECLSTMNSVQFLDNSRNLHLVLFLAHIAPVVSAHVLLELAPKARNFH